MALMKKTRLIISFLLIAMLFVFTTSASAQSNYLFSLDKEVVEVSWNADGSLGLDYLLTFTNDPNGHPIDFVDMGMPNGNFDMNTVSADVAGQAVDTSTSDYQGSGSGFAVVMGSQTIPSGGSGSVHVSVGKITGVLYQDTSTKTDASADFGPLYFGSQYVHGNTDMTVTFHLPPGVQPQEPRYHSIQGGWPCGDQAPASAYDAQNRITYTWQCPNASGSAQYTFGASFPAHYIPASAIVVPAAFDISGIMDWVGNNFSGFCCVGFFIFLFVGIPILNASSSKKRKLAYLPPKIQIEGHGIKRGLTAVEASILMEQPLDKVMTMVLFGVIKKNAARVVPRAPLNLQLATPLPAGLQDYEKDFLQAFGMQDLAARRKALQDMTIKLVNGVSDKMKGFSRKETIAFYQSIMERAWQQIETAGTPEVKSQMYDQSLEWTMLDKNYDQRTRNVFTGPIFLPMWWGNYDPGYHPVSTASVPSVSMPTSGGSRGPVSIPGSAFAASVVGGVQGFSSKVLGDVKSFTSGVTNRTNPVPVVKSSGGGGFHSGGGCACACACAGCACACAGGGR
jgi:hypothetical protein